MTRILLQTDFCKISLINNPLKKVLIFGRPKTAFLPRRNVPETENE